MKMIKRKLKKNAQQEILGFVLIVVLVTIIGVVFLSFSIGKARPTKQTSAEISNLLEASMYHTTTCAVNYIPQYREVQDLIKECYKNPEQKCLSKSICDSENPETKFSFNPTQGPWEDISPSATASQPVLVLSGLSSGEKIKITKISGNFNYQGGHSSNCENGPLQDYGSAAIGGFYNNNKVLIQEYNLRDFENEIATPIGATKLYAYIRESGIYRQNYQDNTGECVFYLNSEKATCNNNVKDITVCESLSETLKDLIDQSLNVGEVSPNKAYNLRIYYNSLNSLNETTDILLLQEGIFKNCSSKPGGSHSIAVTLSSGTINTELEVCRGEI